MSTAYYSLRITSTNEQIPLISDVLGVPVGKNSETGWTYEVIRGDTDSYFDFITRFLEVLKGKFTSLERIGVKRDDISFWAIYEYQEQFNIEYSPQDMKKMANEGITLCVSCYQP